MNRPRNFMEVDEENFDEIVRVNTWGVIVCTQEAAKQMIAQGSGGKIINTGSIASRQGFWDFVPYCVAKFGTLAVTQATARGLIEHGITVNAFAPGVVDTPMWVGLNEDIRAIHAQPDEADPMREFATGTLIGRPAAPAELAPFLVYLASSESDYMTGPDVHGGRRAGPCLTHPAAGLTVGVRGDRPDGPRDGAQRARQRVPARRVEPHGRALQPARRRGRPRGRRTARRWPTPTSSSRWCRTGQRRTRCSSRAGSSSSLRPGSIVLEMSTIGPTAVAELATEAGLHDVHLLDAPVSGSVSVAEAAQLFAMVGGDRGPYVRVTPVLDAMTNGRHLLVGPSGAGAAMKLAVNSMIAVTNEAIAETLALAERFGIERERAYDVLAGGALASPFLLYKRGAFLHPETEPVAFTTSLMCKDVSLAQALAMEVGVRTPATAAARDVLEEALSRGLADEDFSSVIEPPRGRAGRPRSNDDDSTEEP